MSDWIKLKHKEKKNVIEVLNFSILNEPAYPYTSIIFIIFPSIYHVSIVCLLLHKCHTTLWLYNRSWLLGGYFIHLLIKAAFVIWIINSRICLSGYSLSPAQILLGPALHLLGPLGENGPHNHPESCPPRTWTISPSYSNLSLSNGIGLIELFIRFSFWIFECFVAILNSILNFISVCCWYTAIQLIFVYYTRSFSVIELTRIIPKNDCHELVICSLQF